MARLETENGAIEGELAELQRLSNIARQNPDGIAALRERVREFSVLRAHYTALQNELFPLFEAASPNHACVKLMWAIEDDALALQRSIAKTPSGEDG